MFQEAARRAVLDDHTPTRHSTGLGQRRTSGYVSRGEQAYQSETSGGFDRCVEHGIKIDDIPRLRRQGREHVFGGGMANGDAPHRRDEGRIAMVPAGHAVGDHRGEECGALECLDLAIRTDRVRGHDGISPEAARAIEKSIARFQFSDRQQAVAASGLHCRDTMVCHVGMKVVTAPAIDQAQLIAVDDQGAPYTMPTNEGREALVTSTDAGTLETCGYGSGLGDDVRVWRRCGGDEDVRRKQDSHG